MADRRELFVRVVQALGATSFLLAAIYFWFPALIIGRGVFLLSPRSWSIAVVIGWRLAFDWLSQPRRAARAAAAGRHQRRRGRPGARAVRARRRARRRDRRLRRSRSGAGRQRRSSIRASSARSTTSRRSCERAPVDRVVVSLADARGKLPMDKLLEMKLDGVTFDHLASVYEEYTGKIAVENLRPSWLIFSAGFRKSRWLARGQARARRRGRRRSASCWRRRSCCSGRCGDQADVARARRSTTSSASASTAASSRSTSSARCGRTPKRRPARCGRAGRRSARHAGRPVPAADAARRAAAVVERAAGRHEPRRAAAGAAGVRRSS